MSELFSHVFKIDNITKHENSDNLSYTQVYGTPDKADSGYTVIFRTVDFKIGDLAIFFSTDVLLPLANPKFSFLAKPDETREFHRVTASCLRKKFSYGIIVPADPDMQEGDDVLDKLGIGKYDISEDPKVQRGYAGSPNGSGGTDEQISAPIDYVKYDLNGLRKFANLFKEEQTLENGTVVPADLVICREKAHGENISFCWAKGKFYVRSRTQFKKGPQDFDTCYQELLTKKKKYKKDAAKAHAANLEAQALAERNKSIWNIFIYRFKNVFKRKQIPVETNFELTDEEIQEVVENAKNKSKAINKFWKAALNYNIEEKTKNHQNYVFFGEKVGNIALMNYGFSNDNPGLLFFDIYDLITKRFLPELEMRKIFNELDLPIAPIVYEGPYNYDLLLKLAEGKTLVNNQNHIREGLVCRSLDGNDIQVGRNYVRPVLKLVSQAYLAPKK